MTSMGTCACSSSFLPACLLTSALPAPWPGACARGGNDDGRVYTDGLGLRGVSGRSEGRKTPRQGRAGYSSVESSGWASGFLGSQVKC
ncbi:hypothetical protein B0H16DRAFT_1635614 [Mycena metata]|uniref:Secreted protein n=1 Tax=Mycena metata TaxID=1033252 RepID=A0AAD7M8M4_9AGAR|nr:hypothetical protein B0H16DRAFT_1635614 [Mycena metata]